MISLAFPHAPSKPFLNFKWRWAVLTPTESLNSPPVYLGILRALYQCQGLQFRSEELNKLLVKIKKETETSVDLVRSQDRNIFRNSQQYWKALGLLVPGTKKGEICLSQFGRDLAQGEISKSEFALTTIKTLTLPNKSIQSDIKEWNAAGLSLKPLELILKILVQLNKKFGSKEAYIKPKELCRIIIPLSGINTPVEQHADALYAYRINKLNVTEWPNCTPGSNDERMAREFLLFFYNYGLCDLEKNRNNKNEKYIINKETINAFQELLEIPLKSKQLNEINEELRTTGIPDQIDRERVLREVIQRTEQTQFRKNILNAFNSKCLITGVKLNSVLEAAHIKPVANNGIDDISNGLCLRSDIHTLFDRNHMRILPNGQIQLSKSAKKPFNYESIPKKIEIPNFINLNFIEWRLNYY